MTSASCFYSPSDKPYFLYTTDPTQERGQAKKNGEFSSIVTLGGSDQADAVPLSGTLAALGAAGAIIAGAASPRGDMVALVERSGLIHLLRLVPKQSGGLTGGSPGSAQGQIAQLKDKLTSQASQGEISPSTIGFKFEENKLELFAIDQKGQVIHKQWADAADLTNEVLSRITP